MVTVRVSWRIEGGQAKGSVVGDDAVKLRKIVFVDRSYRGRWPGDGEETAARIIRDTKPSEHSKGALLVYPVFAADPVALTSDEARAELLRIIGNEGIVFGQQLIPVDLPGWSGELVGSFPKRFEPGPLYMQWRFTSEDGCRLMCLGTPNFPQGVILSTGIRVGHGPPVVCNWAQAVADLGKPKAMETEGQISCSRVRWVDQYGGSFVADLRQGAAMAAGVGQIRRAELIWEYGHYMSAGTRQAVIGLLRTGLHSAEWHKQDKIRRETDERASWGNSVWEMIRTVERHLADPITPRRLLDVYLSDLRAVRTGVDRLELTAFRFSGAGDPDIYDAVTLDDAAEVARLSEENAQGLSRIDQRIAEIAAAVQAAKTRLTEPETLIAAWIELDGLSTRIKAFLASYGQEAVCEVDTLSYVERHLVAAVESVDQTSGIERQLLDFYELRNQATRALELAMRRIEGASTSDDEDGEP
ncbi:MAG: hypothetical protein UY92_C0006G0016 [Candidatus Magasanikbacteria bacterium GW2011_GWA2_56_11]|uniref:Uncharacterized protein n=1 Tax=Candidatus Magasanikbacteria bacterium GW2011_GWA2_56_11 TaxID=1619044 RepID=A0A0G1YGV0_9BACT|nr:MAG: hypothetical protein UY92_C0006G0016 [Candidatus Magasanikbacteria bacterium GW2011_GWA2_56_11]